MKKSLFFMALLFVAFVLVACGTPTYEVALVTDHGPVTDRSFNQGSWEGVELFATENNLTHTYYRPASNTGAARAQAIDEAVNAGAKVVVAPGFAFAEPVFDAQERYPDVKFILLDAQPSKDGVVKVAENTVAIFYAEDESGFLAGYSVVKEGFTKLGYMGGVPVPAVTRFGMGFAEGAEYAAQELDVEVEINYTYLGGFDPKPENAVKASGWYNSGTELIFVAAGSAINNVITSAEEQTGKWVVGANVEQQDLSPRVLTSALKILKETVASMLEDIYNDEFQGGKTLTLDAAAGLVGITQDYTRFENFTKAEYDAIFAKVVAGEMTITGSYPSGVTPTTGQSFKVGEKTTVNFE